MKRTSRLHGLESDLVRLDRLLHREILRLRAAYELSLDEFRGLYISDEQVDRLIADRHGAAGDPIVEHLTREAEALAVARDGEGPLARLVDLFALTEFERDVLALALAPELDLKYETLYGYLNNDVARKRPTVDLALRLFSGGGRSFGHRAALHSTGTLFEEHLLAPVDTADARSSLTRGFAATPAVVEWILDLPSGELAPGSPLTLVEPAGEIFDGTTPDRLAHVASALEAGRVPSLVVLDAEEEGLAEDAAPAIAATLGRPLLRVEATALLGERGDDLAARIRLVARLRGMGVFVDAATRHDADPAAAVRSLRASVGRLARGGVPVMLAVPRDAPWRVALRGLNFAAAPLLAPDPRERFQLWSRALARTPIGLPVEAVAEVAERFVLGPSQIAAAARSVATTAETEDHTCLATPRQRLFQAAREESANELGRLASKVTTGFRWPDLVLPPTTMKRLEEIVGAVRRRETVFGRWAFGRRTGGRGGLMVLFSGASGTGKTMSAAVVAGELGLDLYRIDLAGVVSKYIGETEKNLDRIFSAARRANVVLFFDEADALLGKRSEVKDAHDRYANIEIAYLLQKMEEHDGVVVLASNLAKNMDQAFSRRMHGVVEFPKPDAELRERLWRGMVPTEAPLGADVDFAFLARQFEITGGDIKVIALDAAFQAAAQGTEIRMAHLVDATARQLLKQGRPIGASDFKHYRGLVGGAAS